MGLNTELGVGRLHRSQPLHERWAGWGPLLLQQPGQLITTTHTDVHKTAWPGPARVNMAGQQPPGPAMPNPPPRCPYRKITHRAISPAASQGRSG